MKRFLLTASALLGALSCSVKLDLEGDILAGEDKAVCWMTSLPDEIPVSRLSIPGAHDAASASITMWPTYTRTQELDIAGLWNCGVRAFDLRPAWVDREMGIYHDKYSAHVTLPAILDALCLALDRHPGEGVVIIIRHEEEAGGVMCDFEGNSPSLFRPSMFIAANTKESCQRILDTVHKHLDKLPY